MAPRCQRPRCAKRRGVRRSPAGLGERESARGLAQKLASVSGDPYLEGVNVSLLERVKSLPLPERIELAEAVWESIEAEGHQPPLPPAQALELDRRLEEYRRRPGTSIPWDRVQAELDQKYPGR